MVNLISKVAIVGVVVVATFYQFFLRTILFDALGYGRHVLSIKDFNKYQCQKVDELGLEGCEDMWLHEKTGFLYMACSDSRSRVQWLPAVDHLNATARSLTDRIAVLDTRGSGRLASRIQWLSIENFPGINGDATLNLHGFDVRADKHSDMLRILLINHRPPIDPVTGEALDATVVGANSTIEQFNTKAGSASMKHIRTFIHPLIETPNRVAWVNEDSFVLTNDHSAKVGFRRSLDGLIGGGNVVYCSRYQCNIASTDGFYFPNGLVKGRDGLIYVPNTARPEVGVFALQEDHRLIRINTIHTELPIDNLSVDKHGDIYAAGIPKVYIWAKSSKNPMDIHPPTTVLKIQRGGKGYDGKGRKGHLETHEADYYLETVFSDDGSVLPGATIVVHDADTGRYFLGGAMSPFISICESNGA